jgi:hypothetical protein
MMHPDQIYTVRQLRHQDLRAVAEQARAQRELPGNRTPWGSAGFARWFRDWSARRFRGVTLTGRAG